MTAATKSLQTTPPHLLRQNTGQQLDTCGTHSKPCKSTILTSPCRNRRGATEPNDLKPKTRLLVHQPAKKSHQWGHTSQSCDITRVHQQRGSAAGPTPPPPHPGPGSDASHVLAPDLGPDPDPAGGEIPDQSFPAGAAVDGVVDAAADADDGGERDGVDDPSQPPREVGLPPMRSSFPEHTRSVTSALHEQNMQYVQSCSIECPAQELRRDGASKLRWASNGGAEKAESMAVVQRRLRLM